MINKWSSTTSYPLITYTYGEEAKCLEKAIKWNDYIFVYLLLYSSQVITQHLAPREEERLWQLVTMLSPVFALWPWVYSLYLQPSCPDHAGYPDYPEPEELRISIFVKTEDGGWPGMLVFTNQELPRPLLTTKQPPSGGSWSCNSSVVIWWEHREISRDT